MPEKAQSAITRITLDYATFKGTGAFIAPTYVNYLFGNNGTGKSTIARGLRAVTDTSNETAALRNGVKLTFAPGRTAADYLFLVFNQDYIDANIQKLHDLPGVYTINEVNVEIQRRIDEKSAARDEARRLAEAAKTEREKLAQRRETLVKQLYKDCWDGTEDLRDAFEKTQEGKKKAKPLTEEIQRHQPVEHDPEELKRMYYSAYSDTARRYERFPEIEDAGALDAVSGGEILSVVIANSAQTGFAKFLEDIGATEWMRQGHAEYHEKADGKCPYCGRGLQPDFDQMFIQSFDDSYERNLHALSAFLEAYRAKANTLYMALNKPPEPVYPEVSEKQYRDKLAALHGVILSNIESIRKKVAEPATVVTLDETAPLFRELSDLITAFNKLIDANNSVVAAGPRKRNECRDKVFERMAFLLKDVFAAYTKSDAEIEAEIKRQQGIFDEQTALILRLDSEIRELNSQTVETETAMRNINTMLRDAGFQGFELRPRKDEATWYIDSPPPPTPAHHRNYEVVRTETGDAAKDLSEGEKNFIAFLYFQQRVFGSDSQNGEMRGKIVVIDDPVSSMDSAALFIVGEQVRKMVEICRNNADNRNAVMKGNFIKQIFILTHNAYFHREVTYPHADRYEFVSFFLVRKADNKSSVRLCEGINPDCPTEMINQNPVKNSYAALWDEYKELKSVIPLMNVIRRILEYYFLQLCGYEGALLRKTILEDNKPEFIRGEDGAEDYAKYDIASSLLSYIAATSYGANDGLHFVDGCMDAQLCRDTFRMIFHYMGQEQHYNMMMGNH